MKQSTFIDSTTLMAALSRVPEKNAACIVIAGNTAEEPKRKIASWNWEPMHETYAVPVR